MRLSPKKKESKELIEAQRKARKECDEKGIPYPGNAAVALALEKEKRQGLPPGTELIRSEGMPVVMPVGIPLDESKPIAEQVWDEHNRREALRLRRDNNAQRAEIQYEAALAKRFGCAHGPKSKTFITAEQAAARLGLSNCSPYSLEQLSARRGVDTQGSARKTQGVVFFDRDGIERLARVLEIEADFELADGDWLRLESFDAPRTAMSIDTLLSLFRQFGVRTRDDSTGRFTRYTTYCAFDVYRFLGIECGRPALYRELMRDAVRLAKDRQALDETQALIEEVRAKAPAVAAI